MAQSVFAEFEPALYPHKFEVTLEIGTLAGGIPTDSKVAEAWLRTKVTDKDDEIRRMVAETMAERGVTADEATQIVMADRHLNGFKRDENGLYIEGRQAKAMVKEAANIRWPKARWGPSGKGTKSFFAEHVFIPETRLYIEGAREATGVTQRFVHTWRGSGIQYEEFVENAVVTFTVVTDYEFTDEEWAALWVTGEYNGIGASRALGYGTFAVTGWTRLTNKDGSFKKRTRKATAPVKRAATRRRTA